MRNRMMAVTTLAAAVLCLVGWGLALARAQASGAQTDTRYVYVGLNNNVARIDEETGRIWVLKVLAGVDRRPGVNDIVTYPQHAWRWTEVRVVGAHEKQDEPTPRADEPAGGR